ncbi:hypothetical protein [Flavihumibacter petaseus]|uniref:Uncharacterized protein n=1 Tax=Flavihumibacter petaseus NBRC 106054 TaxID=1220578 RepID=A0A0E9MVG8_9BACT|nr:hypothetical protein [Flavihumibacter petaseus]GAO41574.1 hypothetical protein FPE01S_01_05880 [Flavihumibacter petaseus NBRC 106054]
MKHIRIGYLLVTTWLLAITTEIFAQDKIVIDKDQAAGFLERNWIWLSIVALAILIIIFSGSGRRRASTTTTTKVVKDDVGNVTRVETTKTSE